MGKASKTVIVDTYALMAKATGEITSEANDCLESVRSGKLRGIIHPIITYEFLLQFYKGRLPVFVDSAQALEFLETHFSTMNISSDMASKAAEIRFRSSKLLTKLRRRLSVCDSLTITIAKETNSSVLTGDKDLQTVAEKENVTTIW